VNLELQEQIAKDRKLRRKEKMRLDYGLRIVGS
jgi:hypothetical protein